MLLNSKKKFTFTSKSTWQFFSVVIVSQLLVACCSSQTAQFSMKNFCWNKEDCTKAAVLAQKKLNEKNQSNEKKRRRAIVGKPYQIKGKWYYPQHDPSYQRVGQASWYGSDFHGRLTANGEIYDMNLLTAAHPTMPLPSYARVTNLKNGSSIVVRVNDRGPFMKDRIIDLSKKAATILGYVNAGVTNVKVEYLAEAPIGYYDAAYLTSSYVPGNSNSHLLASVNNFEKREHVILKENKVPTEQLIQTVVDHEKVDKAIPVKLPKIGPVLIEKPELFDQVASVSEENIKMKINQLQLFKIKELQLF
ncbi:septal ring lytic transglycosylase RlpA family protein [Bartonella raoultii]|uniref:Endolytic peptidoglycan transglycosylase RlpA n=1 Tax=Bartonella raoultii TaxID=1457020 RepID=A0ABS7I4L7_9HYPH|nr:septal ring lytic transglycosylase RlpA family protein [Bartonella raoultii]MBX4335743.1 septal ring lytic transglycosylase RlpA family protein [Bartonella raoultii]